MRIRNRAEARFFFTVRIRIGKGKILSIIQTGTRFRCAEEKNRKRMPDSRLLERVRKLTL
ncbi:hypothetical protein CEF21_18875 [Bacillus sp. FJAT-42376]|nr:hypothetical protein CEF21_18875 [Bacillus sp. FJAT-42376]